MKREPIYQAVFDLAKSNLSGIKNYSRRLKLEGAFPSVEMPALFQVQQEENPTQHQKLPTKWDILLHWVFYFSSGLDNNYVISTDINNAMDEVEAIFLPNPGTGIQNLGIANVSHAWMGRVQISEGILGESAVVLVPIAILVSGQK